MLNINLYNLILILMTGKRLIMEEIGFIRGLLRVGYSTTNIIDTFHQSYSRRIGRFTITRIKNPKYTATTKIGPKFKRNKEQAQEVLKTIQKFNRLTWKQIKVILLEKI
jgi:hypothetical protein